MSQIARLRARLKNVNKTTTEYRMTVAEAKGLLDEIAALEKKALEEKPQIAKAVEPEPVPITRIIDGGTF
jgi:hypothetical protein